MTKKEFKDIIENNTKGEIFLSKGICMINSTIVTKNGSFMYTGEDARKNTINYLWRHVKKNGIFHIGEKVYNLHK